MIEASAIVKMLGKQINVNVLYAISFIDLLGIGLMFPLFYPYLRTLGASHILIGVFGSTYSGLQVLSGPVIGSWSDLRGRRFVSIVTLCVASLSYFLIGVSSSIIFIFILRVVLGIIKHTQTLCKAIISDLYPREKHTEIYGRSAAIGSFGFVVGPIIGGHLSELSHGFFYVCTLTSVLFIINIGLVVSLPEIVKKQEVDNRFDNDHNHNRFFSIRNIGKELLRATRDLAKIDWNIYWNVFALRFLFSFAISIYFSNQGMYVQEKFNLSQRFVGYTISLLSVVGSIAGLMLGTITRKFYKNDLNCSKRLLHSFITISLSFVGLYLAPNLIIFIALLVPFGIANSILRIVSMEVIISRSKSEARGSLSGASNSIMSIARFISPLTSGVVGDVFGENAVMLSAFIPSLLGCFLCLKIKQ